MDDETAEIELLEQNLNKTRQISQRMISILSSFDTRLVKVENSIRPLYSSSEILNRRGNNIEAALQKIDEVKSNQEGIAAEEALILRGPQPGQLDAYKDVLGRLNTSIAFKSLDRDLGDTARLVETGAKKLSQLYTKLVAEGSSGVPLNGPEFVPSPFPASVKQSLLPVVSFLRTLPLPPTHPSHPAAAGIQATLKEAQKGYADMRGSWIRKCLENYGRRVVDRAESIDGVASGRELGAWVGNLLNVAEAEYELLVELAPLPNQAILPNTYSTLINPLITLFSTTLSSLGSLIKRSLHKNTFLALSVYGNLSSLQSRWDDLLCKRPGRKENELKDALHSLRASCLRAFPELLADIKSAALSTRAETNVGLADFSLSTVQFLERIPEVQMAVASALITLGDGNWKMGEGVKAVGNKVTDIDEQTILEHYVYDVVNALLATLNTVSRSNKRPAFGAIFLLNNVSYLNTYLVDQPRPEIACLLSKPTKDALTSNFRIAKAGYFDTNFSPLMSALQEDKDKSKSATKERFIRFYDLLEEVAERHRLAKVLHDDRVGRDTVCEEVVKLVVPSLQRFTQRNTGKEFSKNPQKYIKMTTEEVESLIRSFYSDAGAKRTSIADRTQNQLLAQAGWSRQL